MKSFLEKMKKSSGRPNVRIGFLGGKVHQGEGESLTVAQIAAYNEFGTERTPERSFIRSTLDENRQKYIEQTKNLYRRCVLQQLTVGQALRLMGELIKADIQNKIVNGPFTANSPATIKRKGSSKPLIDTGQMRQSVTYQVKENGE